MMERIKQLVAAMLAEAPTTRIGTIYDYDPNSYAVRVELQPDGVITGWMPLGSQWVGNGWGLACGPSIGDMIRVDFDGHSVQAPFAGARYFNDVDLPPPVPSGEAWLVHESGTYLKLHNDGSVALNTQGALSATVGGNLTANVAGTATGTASSWTLNGNLQVNGTVMASKDISDNNGSYGTLNAIRTTYNGHTHTDPQGGTTSTPSPQMP